MFPFVRVISSFGVCDFRSDRFVSSFSRRCVVIFLYVGGWGAVSLFPLVACMLHVGCWLRMIDDDDPSVISILFYVISDDVFYRDRMVLTMYCLSRPDDNYL